MPNVRLMLWIALAAVLYLNYDAWMRDYGAPAAAPKALESTSGSGAAAGAKPAPTLGDTVPQAASMQANAPSVAAVPAAAAGVPAGSGDASVGPQRRAMTDPALPNTAARRG